MGIGTGVLKKVGNSILSRGQVSKVSKMGAGAFAVDTAFNIHGGDDVGTSIAKASVTGLMTASNPALMTTLTLGSLAIDGVWGVKRFNHQKQQWWNSQYATNNIVGGNYIDTQRAQTMRQASVQAIQSSKMNARSSLGEEAKLLSPFATRRY